MALKDFTPYAKATTAQIADHCRGLAAAGRPVISFDHVKRRRSMVATAAGAVVAGLGQHGQEGRPG